MDFAHTSLENIRAGRMYMEGKRYDTSLSC